MAAADIGANFSSYTGNAALGGGDLGVAKIDTSPIQNLAYYTFQYNKSEYDQRQKDTDAKIKELATMSVIDLQSLKGKVKDDVSKKFLELQEYAKNNYLRRTGGTAEEKLNAEMEWQEKKGKLLNSYNNGKVKTLEYYKELNEIDGDGKLEATEKEDRKKDLETRWASADIDTPMAKENKYEAQEIGIPKATGTQRDQFLNEGNTAITNTYTLFNVKQADADSTAVEYGLKRYVDKNSPEYINASPEQKRQFDKQAAKRSEAKLVADSANNFNAGINEYRKADGSIDEAKISANGLLSPLYEQIKVSNEYHRKMAAEARSGKLTDEFGAALLDPKDYESKIVDLNQPVSAKDLIYTSIYKTWGGDKVEKKGVNTGEANDMKKTQIQANVTMRGQTLNNQEARARLAFDYSKEDWNKMEKGWTKEKGKWKPPVAGAVTAANNGGIVPYWESTIAPQIKTLAKGMAKMIGVSESATIPDGDFSVSSDQLSGLGVALTGGETITSTTDIKIRYVGGKPVGVVIADVFYDQNDINSKATQTQNKSMSTKIDNTIYQNGTAAPAGKTQAQLYLEGLKK